MTSKWRFRLLIATVTVGLCIQPVLAQETVGSLTGKRVRVTTVDSPKQFISGRVTSATITEVVLKSEDSTGESASIPIAEILRMQVNTGTKNNLRAGAVTGLGLGALGAGIAVASIDDNSEAWAIGLIVGGVVVGGLIGSLITSEKWAEVSPNKLRLGLRGHPRGIPGATLVWKF